MPISVESVNDQPNNYEEQSFVSILPVNDSETIFN